MNNIIIITYIFAIGVILGSFFNVCIYRIPKGESVVTPPSHCSTCGTRLRAGDLIPVFSYILLRGKCRYCGSKFSMRYVLIEVFTGIIFAGVFIKYGFSFDFLKYVVLASFLIVIGIIDYDTTDVYFKTTASGIISGGIFIVIGYFLGKPTLNYLYGALIGGGAIAAIIILTKGMGWGDVEICALGGIFLGLKLTLVMLFFSFIFGSIAGITLIALKKKSRKDYIPFGPYIAMGAVFAMFFGEKIINWYLY